MNTDLLRLVDAISRDKNIDKEGVFGDLEVAMESAVRKAFHQAEDVTIGIDRTSGDIQASVDGESIDMRTLGRIAAQTAKQVMIQKIREDERGAIFEEYSQRVGEVVTGTVTRYEGGVLVVNLGRAEAILPRSEQIPGESHHTGERIRAMILDVREEQSQVRIVLTQTHPDYIRRLFELEVPEVGERIIEIRALAREAGYRTKIAVSSIDSKVDAVGACVGIRGSRIRNIVDELGGEKIDIVRWNESSQVLITNALKPVEVKEVFLCFELGRATVIVDEDQLSLAIGKRGQNVRLAARLTGWDIDILTPAEHDKNVDDMEKGLKRIDGVEDVLLDKLLAMGMISLGDLAEVGAEPLKTELELEEALAGQIVEVATQEAQRLAAEAEAAKQAAALSEKESQEAAESEAPSEATDADSETPSEAADSDEAMTEETKQTGSETVDGSALVAGLTEESESDGAGQPVDVTSNDQDVAAVVPSGELVDTVSEEPVSEETKLETGTVESSESL